MKERDKGVRRQVAVSTAQAISGTRNGSAGKVGAPTLLSGHHNSATDRPEDTVAHFFTHAVRPRDFVEMWFSTAYLEPAALELVRPWVRHFVRHAKRLVVFVGANDGQLTVDVVRALARMLRKAPSCELYVVHLGGTLRFHPKTAVLVRNDGTAVTLNGSPNATYQACSGANIEVFDVICTRERPSMSDFAEGYLADFQQWLAMPSTYRADSAVAINRLAEEGTLTRDDQVATTAGRGHDGGSVPSRRPTRKAAFQMPRPKRRRKPAPAKTRSAPVQPVNPVIAPPLAATQTVNGDISRVGPALKRAREDMDKTLDEIVDLTKDLVGPILDRQHQQDVRARTRVASELAACIDAAEAADLQRLLKHIQMRIDNHDHLRKKYANKGLAKSTIWEAENGSDVRWLTLSVLRKVYGRRLSDNRLKALLNDRKPSTRSAPPTSPLAAAA